jgi:hypothetical protein
MSGDWRVWRPAIWLAMLGVAIILAFNPFIGIAVVGGAIGVAIRIRQGIRRAAAAAPTRPGRRGRH